MAIPARPQLPAFLNDVIGSAPTPAPAAVAAASPQAAFNDVTKGRQFRSYASGDEALAALTGWQDAKKARRQTLADTQGWANFQRRAYGLADKPAAAEAAPAVPTEFVGWLNKLSSALTPAGGQPYNFPLLQQLLGNGISIPQLPGS
jgi:hypothetical protein